MFWKYFKQKFCFKFTHMSNFVVLIGFLAHARFFILLDSLGLIRRAGQPVCVEGLVFGASSCRILRFWYVLMLVICTTELM